MAWLLHSSGTTGQVKWIPYRQRRLLGMARNFAQVNALGPSDRCINLLPLAYIHGLGYSIFATMVSGGSVFCAPGFFPASFPGWLREWRPTWYTVTPAMHQALLAPLRANIAILKETPLRFIRSGGAALPVPLLEELESVTGLPVIESYGMTELGLVASNPQPPAIRRPGSPGLAAQRDVQMLGDNDQPLGPYQTGEISVRLSSLVPM